MELSLRPQTWWSVEVELLLDECVHDFQLVTLGEVDEGVSSGVPCA